ncbi:MAG: PorT family protein [Flavobacteriales bacterium]|nr:PorT family protein [Flavobacteriales bacterium]
MRKAFALLTAALLAAPALNAQDTGNEGVRFGIKLAPNMCWSRSDTKGIEGDGSRIGYTFGLLTEFPIGANGNYRFATGVFLNNIGGKTKTEYSLTTDDGQGNSVTTKYVNSSTVALRYVEVPLTIKMMTNEIGLIRYYGQLGVSMAANVRAKQDYELTASGNGSTTTTSDTKIDVKDDTDVFKAALVVGAGMEYNVSGNTSLLVGLTYNNAFTSANKKDGVSGFDNAKIYADYLELTLGVFF